MKPANHDHSLEQGKVSFDPKIKIKTEGRGSAGCS